MADIKVTADEIVSAFSELIAGHAQDHAEGNDCIVCTIGKIAFPDSPKGLSQVEKEVWATLVNTCIPPPAALIWSATQPAGFSQLCAIVLAMGISIGRRQSLEELYSKGASA